jgi:hypothetical protein
MRAERKGQSSRETGGEIAESCLQLFENRLRRPYFRRDDAESDRAPACRSVVVQRCYFAIQQWPVPDSRAHAGGMMHEDHA